MEKRDEINLRVPNDGLNNNWKQFTVKDLGTIKKKYTTYMDALKDVNLGYWDEKNQKWLNKGAEQDYIAYQGILEIIDKTIEYKNNTDPTQDDKKSNEVDDLIEEWNTNWDLFGLQELKTKEKTYLNNIDALKAYKKAWKDLSEDEKGHLTESNYNISHNKYLKYWEYEYGKDENGNLYAEPEKGGCSGAIKQRQGEYDDIQNLMNGFSKNMSEVTTINNKEKCGIFTKEDLETLNKLYNETDYVNDNIITISTNTAAEIINTQYELFQDATTELSKVCQPQLSFTLTMDNIFAIPGFKEWQGNFDIGNFIHLSFDKDDQYFLKLRISSLTFNPYTVTKTGSGASGTWGISISGNATTSTKLATARSINGTNFDGSGNITTATWGTARTLTIGNTGKSVNGGGNVSWSLSEIGAAASNHTHSYLPLSGGAMTGNISYRGSKATYKMIEFIDNSSDEYGNGIAIGGGGLTIIGGGESADVVKSTSTRGGDERLILANDGAIDIYTNCQNGIDKATHITIDNTGLYSGTAAKANSVPWSGVTGKPSTYTPSSHNHTVIQGTSSTSAVPGKANDGFCEFYYNVNNRLANNMPSSNNANAIISISRHAGDYTSQLGFSSNGNLYYREGVGATAWKTILTSSNYTSYTVTKTGGGASGTWGINITGSSGSCTGNAATASNASKVNGHTVNSDVPSGAKFTDTNTWRPLGTAANTACAGNDSRLSNSRPASDVYSWAKASSKPSYSWSEITSKPSTFTPASHTHAYIPLSGGTITGSIIRSSGGSWISARNNVAVRGTATGKDSWNPVVGQATPNGYWTIGNLASNDNLAFSYTSNTNYNAGNNSATTVYLPVQEGTIITSATIGSQSVKYATSAGSAGSVAWGNVSGKPSSYTPSSHTHDDRYYTETEINTKLGTKLGAVSANGYYGMARPDGNTSDWIRTTTAGIIPYQSGGAGGGHCGLGTSSWYFSNAYIDTVNCVNASVSGHIDVGGYIQSSNLINTYFEYQSNRGSVDWRFGAATGTSDENFFGFYDAKTGKIPLALDGNFGNIYVGFNVGSYESPTAVGVYLGGQVAGNRAFIYNGDSYQGSIWIQTRLDGSWKWFSLGRACSTALSDIRLKGNIRDTEVEDATKVIESMKIRSFERKDSHKKYKIGFIADELEQLDPNLVDGGGEVDGHPYYKSVNNLQMLAYVVKGMQELNSKVTILEKENKRLKQKLNMCN